MENNKKHTSTKETENTAPIFNGIDLIIPAVNNFSSRKEWREFCWQNILKSKKLLRLLVTVDEQNDLVMRAAALKGITMGKSYRGISKEFFVSLQTIGAVKKAMDEHYYRSYAERKRKEQEGKKRDIALLHKGRNIHRRYVRTKYGKVYVSY